MARTALTVGRHLALTIGPSPRGDEPDDVLADVYFEHRDRLLATQREPFTRPWGWWAFEPDVPDDLQEPRAVLEAVGGDHDAVEYRERHDRARRELDRRRRGWLAAHPEHLTTVELSATERSQQ